MKVSDNFDLRELVHPDIYNHPAIGDRCADFIHCEAANTLEAIKLSTGDTITINSWLWGGNYKDSGLRLPSGSVGATLSSHRFGCGFDLKFKNMSAEEAHAHIIENQHLFKNVTRMESIDKTPTWVHIEIGARRDGEIIIFNP